MHLGQLLMHKTYVFNGEVNSDTVSEAVVWLANHSTLPEVTIVMTTLGGSVHQGVALFDSIHLLRDKVAINVVALGACQSAGITMLLGAKPERRFTAPNTRFMVHPPGMLLDGGRFRAWGSTPSPDVLKCMNEGAGESVSETFALRENLLGLLVANTVLTMEQATKAYDDNLYFGAEQALEMGIVGNILKPDPPSQPSKKRRWPLGRRR